MYNAGLLSLQGRNAGDSVGGAAAAATWFLQGAEHGHAGAQHRYASLVYEGAPGVPASTPDALKWWRAAATQGHADALCSLGCVHQTGSACGAVPVDVARAAVLFEQAAQGGSADGAYHLAYFYAKGVGTEPDLEVATALLRQVGCETKPRTSARHASSTAAAEKCNFSITSSAYPSTKLDGS